MKISLEEKYEMIFPIDEQDEKPINDLGFYVPPEKKKRRIETTEFDVARDSFGKTIIVRREFVEHVVCDGLDFYFVPKTAIIGSVYVE